MLKIFGFILLFIATIDLILGGTISTILELNVDLIINQNQYWRLITYPFAFGGIHSMFISVITFLFFGSKFENYFRHFSFVILSLITLMHGIIFIWLNFNESNVFQGSEGLAFFLLFLYIILNRNTYFRLNYISFLNRKYLVLLLILTWFSILHLTQTVELGTVHSSILFSFMGFANSFIYFVQQKVANLIIDKKSQKTKVANKVFQNEHKELTMAIIESERKKYKENAISSYYTISYNKSIDEDKVNKILEKISSSGINSLNDIEKKFLEEYSNNI